MEAQVALIAAVTDCTCGRRHNKTTATGNSSGGEIYCTECRFHSKTKTKQTKKNKKSIYKSLCWTIATTTVA